MDVVSVGDLNIDLISQPLDDFPRKEASTIIDYYVLMVGGCAANFAAGVASLGHSSRFLGLLGDDAMSEWLVEEMERYGVEVRAARKPGTTCGITMAFAFKDGSRAYLATFGSNGQLRIDDLDLSLLSDARHLHRSGYWWAEGMVGEPTARLLETANKEGAETSLDIGWDYRGWGQERVRSVMQSLPYTDVFFANRDEVERLTGERDPFEGAKRLVSKGPRIVALHLGQEGAAAVTEKETVVSPSHKVSVVNPTGTGDVFNASFVVGLLRGWDLQKTCDHAVAAAEVHIQRTDRSFPTEEKIRKWLSVAELRDQ